MLLLLTVMIPLLVLSGTHLPKKKKRFGREGFRRSEEKKREKHTEVVKRRKEVEDVSTSIIPEGKKTHTHSFSVWLCLW